MVSPPEARRLTIKRRRQARAAAVIAYPIPPAPIQILDRPRNVVNHSYRDFSQVPAPTELFPEELPPGQEQQQQEHAGWMSFPKKLHEMLKDPTLTLQPQVEWMPHGRAFRLVHPVMLEKYDVLIKYFGFRRLCVFISVLNSFGFKQITHGKDRGCYYHELFLRDLVHLTCFFPMPQTTRRLQPDPQSEPDFYAISQKFPLPTTTNGRNLSLSFLMEQ